VPGREQPLRLYGQRSDRAPLAWSWVEEQLAAAGTYWVVGQSRGHPHPRPVWGVWDEQRLHLSVGSPVLRRALRAHPAATVHLDSGTDVVIVEGLATEVTSTAPAAVEAYNRKYDWDYRTADYGELTVVAPVTVLAWRTAGWAGRDSFQQTGRWVFDRTQPNEEVVP
jgi:hypothetical protein